VLGHGELTKNYRPHGGLEKSFAAQNRDCSKQSVTLRPLVEAGEQAICLTDGEAKSEDGSQSSLIRKRKRNFNFIGMNAPQYYERLQEEFRRLHGHGWTFRKIAQALNISERTVTAWREELDLPRRPRGRRPRKRRR